MVDANAVVRNIGYPSTDETPDVVAAFSSKADELALEGIVAPGDLREGWLDCSQCCLIIAQAGGMSRPHGFLLPDEVQRRFAKANWPSLEGLQKGPVPMEYAYIRIAQTFVDVCLKHGLAIEFS